VSVITDDRAQGSPGLDKDRLLARLDLIARAEEQAATASEQARLTESLESDALECAGVLSLAIEQLSRTHAIVCERLAHAAEAADDVLLARSLTTLAASLRSASRNAGAAAIEAHDFDEIVAAERREANTANTD
jgi:hypothetical protein